MVTGGNDLGGPSVEIFFNGMWRPGVDLPVATKQHCQVTLRDTVLITGRQKVYNIEKEQNCLV